MTAPYARGLVVGKFSPLHRGHELVLRTAAAQCQKLFVLSYSVPSFPGCSVEERERWFAALFPDVAHWALDEERVEALRREHPGLPALPANADPDLAHRVFCARFCLEVLGGPVDAVFTSEDYGEGFAAELTNQFSLVLGHPHPVRHVVVDRARERVPVSATAIRQDPSLGDLYLAPVVRASFVKRICLLGGESSGKTTLTRLLAKHFATTHAEEFGRQLWSERRGHLSFEDYLLVARTQIAWEEQVALAAKGVLFGDSSPLTTLLYCLVEFGRADPALHALANRRYDLTLLCAPDFPFVQDGTRRDAAFRAHQHELYLDQLARRGIPFVLVEGPLERRVAVAAAAVARLPGVAPVR